MNLVGLLGSLVSLFQICLLARAILAIMPATVRLGTWKSVYELLVSLTEPVLRPIRRITPSVGETVDLSPILAVLLLSLIMSLITRL